jgi:hypothetical protein
MDSDEEERLRQWKQHLAAQRNVGDDSDEPNDGSSDDEKHIDVHPRARSASRSERSTNGPGSVSARQRGHGVSFSDGLRDSLTENEHTENQSIDWASTLMPQLRELQDENATLKSKAAAYEKEVKRLRLEQQTIGLDVSTSDGPKVGGDLKDSKIVELAKKNRALTVLLPY